MICGEESAVYHVKQKSCKHYLISEWWGWGKGVGGAVAAGRSSALMLMRSIYPTRHYNQWECAMSCAVIAQPVSASQHKAEQPGYLCTTNPGEGGGGASFVCVKLVLSPDMNTGTLPEPSHSEHNLASLYCECAQTSQAHDRLQLQTHSKESMWTRVKQRGGEQSGCCCLACQTKEVDALMAPWLSWWRSHWRNRAWFGSCLRHQLGPHDYSCCNYPWMFPE